MKENMSYVSSTRGGTVDDRATTLSNQGNIAGSMSLNQRDSETNAWFQELAQAAEEEGDAAFFRLRAPLFEKTALPHVFSAEERRRMDKYESIDYNEAQSLIYRARMSQRKGELRWIKWFVFIAVGICVGLWSVLLFQTLDYLFHQKLGLIERFINTYAHDQTTISSSGDTGGETDRFMMGHNGVSWKALGAGYLIYIAWNTLAALLSSLCCVVIPTSAGSGVPDVMAYLNGVMFPRIFNIRNLITKTLSCVLAVSSGLPVGAEGPMIHIGSLIGAGLPTGRSRTLRCSASSLLSTFRNPCDMRDFISAGAACGVTSAFSAPIGGMLFVMEEIATFFPVKLACLVLVSCLSCMCVIQILNTYLSGWQLSVRLPVSSGEFLPSAISMFIVNTVPGNQVPMNLITFLPTVVGAVALGLLSVTYTVLSVKFSRWRSRRLFPSKILRVLEPCIFAFLYATACYMMPLAFGCVGVPTYVQEHREELKIELFNAFCADREKTFSPLATLTLTSPYNGIRILLSRHTSTLIPWYVCMLHLLLYTAGSTYAGGMFISCGTVIPSLFIGALGGRLIGIMFNNNVWADPGVISLIGSASYFSGISRLSFSLIVIMMEMTSDLTHITCLMVGVIVARALADRCCHSFYHSLLEVKAVPFLEAQASVHKLDMFCARDIMTSPAVTLDTLETVTHLQEVLRSTPHNIFPVVSTSRGTYSGVISRSQLELLLWFMYFRDCNAGSVEKGGNSPSGSCGLATETSGSTGKCGDDTSNVHAIDAVANAATAIAERLAQQPHATYMDLSEVREQIFWKRLPSLPPMDLFPSVTARCYVNLAPYVDLSTCYVRDVMCISRTYYIFRHLGLRQLPIVDRNNCVVGVITRKNLVGDRLHKRLKEAEVIANQAAEKRAQRMYRKQQ